MALVWERWNIASGLWSCFHLSIRWGGCSEPVIWAAMNSLSFDYCKQHEPGDCLCEHGWKGTVSALRFLSLPPSLQNIKVFVLCLYAITFHFIYHIRRWHSKVKMIEKYSVLKVIIDVFFCVTFSLWKILNISQKHQAALTLIIVRNVSWATRQHIKMNTEDWSNSCWNSKYNLKFIQIKKSF